MFNPSRHPCLFICRRFVCSSKIVWNFANLKSRFLRFHASYDRKRPILLYKPFRLIVPSGAQIRAKHAFWKSIKIAFFCVILSKRTLFLKHNFFWSRFVGERNREVKFVQLLKCEFFMSFWVQFCPEITYLLVAMHISSFCEYFYC